MDRKRKAWVAVVRKDGFGVGIAVEDEPGYYQTDYETVPTYRDADQWAGRMNESLGLNPKEVMEIVCSTFRAQRGL